MSASELERGASELERERDEARDAVAAREDAYRELEKAWLKKAEAHGRMTRVAIRLGVVAAALFVLLVISVLVAWLLLT